VGAVIATEKFAFQQPSKYRQRKCILRRWRQTVPHARTGDTECAFAYGSPSRPRDVQSGRGRGRGSQPSRDIKAATSCSWSAIMVEQYHGDNGKRAPQVWTACAQVQTTSAVPWAVALCARTSVWSRSAEQWRAEQTEVAPSTVHSDQPMLHCHSQDVSRQATAQATATQV